jgi:hypothetical protein
MTQMTQISTYNQRLMRPFVLAIALALLAYPAPDAVAHPADASALVPRAQELVDRLLSGQVTMEDFGAWKRALGSRPNVELKSYRG